MVGEMSYLKLIIYIWVLLFFRYNKDQEITLYQCSGGCPR